MKPVPHIKLGEKKVMINRCVHVMNNAAQGNYSAIYTWIIQKQNYYWMRLMQVSAGDTCNTEYMQLSVFWNSFPSLYRLRSKISRFVTILWFVHCTFYTQIFRILPHFKLISIKYFVIWCDISTTFPPSLYRLYVQFERQ